MVTDLDAECLPAVQALELYRLRRQIELAFQRLKSLLGPGNPRAKNGAPPRTYLLSKLLGALLVYTTYFVGLFLLGAFAASSAAQVFAGGPDAQLIVLGAGALGGALAVVFRKIMIVFATATSGATLVMWSVALYLSGTHAWDPQQAASRLAKMGTPMTLSWLGLAAAGLLVQLRARPISRKAPEQG